MTREFTDRYGKPIQKGAKVAVWKHDGVVFATVQQVNFYECEVSTTDCKRKIVKDPKKIIAL